VPVVLVLYVMTAILFVIRWRIGNQCSCLRNSVALTVQKQTANICRKRHRIVEIYPSYRKSRSRERMAESDFRPEAPN